MARTRKNAKNKENTGVRPLKDASDGYSSETIEKADSTPQTRNSIPQIPDEKTAKSQIEDQSSVTSDTASSRSSSSDVPKRQSKKEKKSKSKPKQRLEPKPTQSSLVSNILSDIRGLPAATYPYWKRPFALYIFWLLLSHLMAAVYVSIIEKLEKLEPICSIPIIGPILPLCHHEDRESTKTVNLTKISSSQQQLESVVESAGMGLGLAMNMLGNEYAIRDLTIRVKHSDLRRKDDLGKELDTLISLTTRTSEYVLYPLQITSSFLKKITAGFRISRHELQV